MKAGLKHNGLALIDVISPCVTFNDHEGSTKSYMYTRKHQLPVIQADFVPAQQEISVEYPEGSTTRVTMHDGSAVALHKVAPGYNPTNRAAVMAYLNEQSSSGTIPTGLLFLDESSDDMHAMAKTVEKPLSQLPYEALCPGNAALQQLQRGYR